MNHPIAVIGLGALFPGSDSSEGFWRTIVSGRDCLTEVPSTHWLLSDYYDADPARPGKTYAKRGAFLGAIPFDPLEHGIPPSVLPATDTAQLLALVVAHRLLQNCSGRFERIDRDRTSVILGVASATELVSTMTGSLQRPVIARALREEGLSEAEVETICSRIDRSYVAWTESTFPGLLGNVVAGRIANRFDLGGTNCVVDAACASSLAAIRMGMQELWSENADMVITGGVDAINDIFMYMCFSKTLAMSFTGDCRPFSADADGTMLGEGIGMFALRRLADAERDGDRIYAVLRGIGASSDGRAKSIYAPRAAGQEKALRRAYAGAGYSPDTVELLEAHGTGTGAGDAAEVEALKTVFGEAHGANRDRCALGSIKSQIGHTKAAAGAASLFKTVMALHHKVLPPTIKVREPNPALGLDESPFYLNTELRPWIRSNSHPRRAGVSSFGFGGSNFHLTLEEYLGPGKRPQRIRTLPSELFLLSGSSASSVADAAKALAQSAGRENGFANAAQESQRTFSATGAVRLAVVAADSADLAAKVDRAAAGIARGEFAFAAAPDIAFANGPAIDGGIAFLFPGQGSQYVGMGASLAMAFEGALRVWDDAANLDPALPACVFPPPAFTEQEREIQIAALTATQKAQPALAVTERMYLALLESAGIKPDCCAGHSFGEVTALFAAGVLDSADFLAVSFERGRLMAAAASQHAGAMLAISASAGEVGPLLPEGVIIANINSPQQVVAAGPGSLIDEASTRLAAHGFTVRLLPVATAFHSPMVESAAQPFADFLSGVRFEAPRVAVFANSTAGEYPTDAGGMRALLSSQLARPVLFAEQIQAMYRAGARTFIEVGPGSVLTVLTSACLEGQPHVAIALDRKGKDAVTAFWLALAKLAVAGISFDSSFAWRDYETAAEPAVRTPHAISLSGTNFGKKYPRPEEPIVTRPRPLPAPAVVHHNGDARLEAIRKIQEQMAESHAATQRALSESHLAYLRATESAFSHLGGDAPVAVPAPMIAVPVQPEFKPAPLAVASAASIVVAAPAKENLTELVMGIVAEKTGYPREILVPAMDLEADLGIDSIKRVQILAAVCEARPDLPQTDAKNMATLRTLGAILEFLREAAPSEPPVAETAAKPSPAGITELVLSVVAEKTGYPREILSLEMDLEADLGIDSIKRVQILAAVRDTRSDLPDVDPKQMGALRTLGAIIAYLGEAQPEAVASALPALPAWLSKNGLQRVALREVVASLGNSTRKVAAPARITVSGDLGTLRDTVAESLKSRGIHISSNGAESDGTVFLAVLPRTLDDMLREAHLAFDAARRSAKSLFVTVTHTESPLRRGLSALAKTVALENPGMVAKAICIDTDVPSPALGERIADEILHATLEPEIILQSDGGRASVEEFLKPVGARIDTSLLQGRPVIVVTGGARGVTASCVRGLAEVAPLRLALLGRSSLESVPAELAATKDGAALKAAIVASARANGESILPKEVAALARRVLATREINETLDKLRELGSEVQYFPCDVTDASAVGKAMDAIRGRWQSIDGLIHGAGVVEDKRIADKSQEQFERVFGTKVLGLRNLLDAIREDSRVRFILLFSSVAGRYGNAGQVDYAMANATMCQMALDEAARRGGSCLVRALGWGPWDGGMVTPDLRVHFENRGIPIIPIERGVAAFVQEVCHLSNDPADIDVVLKAHLSAAPGDAH